MSLEKAITKALGELDSLGESAIRKQILGIGVEEVPTEAPVDEEEKVSPEDEAALAELLSK